MYHNHSISTTNCITGRHGMVATTQPLAAQAGLQILQQGGNAIDAAIATAACLTVVEPTCCGIGGDAFAIIHTKDGLFGINGSGPAPRSISIEQMQKRGFDQMPLMGWPSVTVPGIPKTWAELSKRYGALTLEQVLQPAIHHATQGYRVTAQIARAWERTYQIYEEKPEKLDYAEWFRVFAPHGRVPKEGELWSSMEHAHTLQEIAETKAESFYRGRLAEALIQASEKAHGFLRYEDLSGYEIEWVTPLSVSYRGYDIWELPPNGQGIIALTAFHILEQMRASSGTTDEWYHRQIEAIKTAFVHVSKEVRDPKDVNWDRIHTLLSKDFARSCANQMTERAISPSAIETSQGGTVYLCTADRDGNMVSYIQSNYYGFGSGIVIPNTGIALQNRGFDFKLDEHHPHALRGGQRPYHTIMPGFITREQKPIGPFGVMGGYMQPQAHVQVISHMLDQLLSPQEALQASRFRWVKENQVEVEPEFSEEIMQKLLARGHNIKVSQDIDAFGRGQVILRNPETGLYIGGTDQRVDGIVAAW